MEIVQNFFVSDSFMLGGLDEQGERKVVEINVFLFFRRKYNRGQYRNAQLVFGAIERGTGNCILVPVPDRRAETHIPIICDRIAPGSIIISDSWSSYQRTAEQNAYEHLTINHRYNFVDPLDPGVHTQNIENCWLYAKRNFKKNNLARPWII